MFDEPSSEKSENSTPEITPAVTQQVARLARLAITEDESRVFTGQIGQILNYVEKLQEVDVNGIAPLTHPFELVTPMREDVVVASPRDQEGRPKVLDSAPDVLNDGYKVPPIL